MSARPKPHHFQSEDNNPPIVSILVVLFSLAVLCFGVYYFLAPKLLPQGRYSLLILGDPLEVMSIDSMRQEIDTIRFPKDTQVQGVSGLGQYRLDALWSVAATDATPASVVLESLTDELGVPFDRYIATKGNVWLKRKTDGPIYPTFFSLMNIITFLRHGFESNLTFPEYLGLVRTVSGIDVTRGTEYELTDGNGLLKERSADSIDQFVFDREGFDRMTDDLFQDTDIRQEGMRVAVLNTTGKDRLGTRVARIVSKLGAHVVQVGNDSNLADSCEVVGTKEKLLTKTALAVRQIFGCTNRVVTDEGQADITVRVGKAYAEKYAPKPK